MSYLHLERQSVMTFYFAENSIATTSKQLLGGAIVMMSSQGMCSDLSPESGPGPGLVLPASLGLDQHFKVMVI